MSSPSTWRRAHSIWPTSGLTPDAAARQARVEMGGVENYVERIRDARGFPFLDEFVQDLRHGCRLLAKNPGFTLVAVLSLGLGIGANSAVFSLADALLLRPLPVRAPGDVVAVGTADNGRVVRRPHVLPELPRPARPLALVRRARRAPSHRIQFRAIAAGRGGDEARPGGQRELLQRARRADGGRARIHSGRRTRAEPRRGRRPQPRPLEDGDGRRRVGRRQPRAHQRRRLHRRRRRGAGVHGHGGRVHPSGALRADGDGCASLADPRRCHGRPRGEFARRPRPPEAAACRAPRRPPSCRRSGPAWCSNIPRPTGRAYSRSVPASKSASSSRRRSRCWSRCCWRSSRSSWSSRARTSRTSCSAGRAPVRARLPCGSPSVSAARVCSASCSPRASCWPSSAARRDWSSPMAASCSCSDSASQRIFRSSSRRGSTRACSASACSPPRRAPCSAASSRRGRA